MKVAISSTGGTTKDSLEPRFGRAAGFIIYDLDQEQYEYLDNTANQQASKGAGINAAQNVARAGAKAVISGHVGPKAFDALRSGQIKVFQSQAKSIEEVIADFREGKLPQAEGADSPGHWKG